MSENVRLFVVPSNMYNNMELATVADVEKSEKWKEKMHTWTIARLADGKCDGSGYGNGIYRETPNEDLGHKVVIRREQQIGM